MTHAHWILLSAALLLGCPKQAITTVAGTDDEQIDRLSNQLEELKLKTEVPCAEACALKKTACDNSAATCEIASRQASREDFQKKCVASQEECARFNESCASCSRR